MSMATATTTTTPTSSYGDCVASLRTSLSYLESSVGTLGAGVSDFPRLIAVLKSVRHYELIPQSTLAAAEASLRDEIGPSIAALLDRAGRQLDRQARRTDTLKARAELQAGRLSSSHPDDHFSSSSSGAGKKKTARQKSFSGTGTAGGAPSLRARMVRQRREALKYSVERMEMEVAQKERELRVRLESQGQREGRWEGGGEGEHA